MARARCDGLRMAEPQVLCPSCGEKVPANFDQGLLDAGGSFANDLAGGTLEVLRVDLCKDCGTVARWWVAQADRLWMKRS